MGVDSVRQPVTADTSVEQGGGDRVDLAEERQRFAIAGRVIESDDLHLNEVLARAYGSPTRPRCLAAEIAVGDTAAAGDPRRIVQTATQDARVLCRGGQRGREAERGGQQQVDRQTVQRGIRQRRLGHGPNGPIGFRPGGYRHAASAGAAAANASIDTSALTSLFFVQKFSA